jgi:hypothetical protein
MQARARGWRVVEDDARLSHPQLVGSDEDFSPGLRGGEISGE